MAHSLVAAKRIRELADEIYDCNMSESKRYIAWRCHWYRQQNAYLKTSLSRRLFCPLPSLSFKHAPTSFLFVLGNDHVKLVEAIEKVL